MIEFFTLPQVYFYNHVWGIWPGPIYDEAVNLTGSFLLFRFITLLWITLLWNLPDLNKNRFNKVISGIVLISLIISYLTLDNAGIISPTRSIQERLGAHHETEHFELYYDEDSFTQDEIRYWSARHEFHFQQLVTQLEIDWPEGRKIESYLYAHAWQKKEITGAKFTSYVPIWLDQDQLHIARQQLDRVLKHELAHVISKQFGNSLFNGSWSIGLIEGLAEGIAKDASPRSTLHQIVAAEKPWPESSKMKSALSVTGFYGSAGSISYTTTGSFVEYLLNNYPVNQLKNAYLTSDIEASYSASFDELINGWHEVLRSTELDSVDLQISEFIFAQRSLFQKDCPHSISKALRYWDEYNYLMASKDTLKAYNTLDDLYSTDPENALIKAAWIRSKLDLEKPELVVGLLNDADSLLNIKTLQADAHFMAEGYRSASEYLNTFKRDISDSQALNFRYTLELREDSLQWKFLLDQRYSDHLVNETIYQEMNLPNKLLTLSKALDLDKDEMVLNYFHLLPEEAITAEWFDILEKAIHHAAFLGNHEIASDLLSTMKNRDLRARYRERLSEQTEWLTFLQNRNYIDQQQY